MCSQCRIIIARNFPLNKKRKLPERQNQLINGEANWKTLERLFTTQNGMIFSSCTVHIGIHGSKVQDRSEAGDILLHRGMVVVSVGKLFKEKYTAFQWRLFNQGIIYFFLPLLTWHQILQIELFLLFTLTPETYSSSWQKNCCHKTRCYTCPCHNIWPIVGNSCIVAQNL